MTDAKRNRGLPPKFTMPSRIDARPDEISQKALQFKPPKNWKHLEKAKQA